MDWNPREVIRTLWPIKWARPLLLIEGVGLVLLISGSLIFLANAQIKGTNPQDVIPGLHWLTESRYLGWSILIPILIVVSLGLVLVFWSAANQPQSLHSPATTLNEEPTMQPLSNITQNIYGGNYGLVIGQLTIQGDSQPRIALSNQTETKLADETYRYTSILNVQTTYLLPQLKVIARAPSISSLDVIPQRSGVSMTGHSGKRDGFVFTTLQNVAGVYQIGVVTAKQEQVIIDLEG